MNRFTRYGRKVERAYIAKYGTQKQFIEQGLKRPATYRNTLIPVLCGIKPGRELKKQIAEILGVEEKGQQSNDLLHTTGTRRSA